MESKESVEPRLTMLRALPLMHRLLRLVFSGEREHFTKTQFYILITLFIRPALSMTQLCEHIGASKEQATRAVAPLVDDGLVQREVSSRNRTKVYVSLTQEGRALVQDLIMRCGDRINARMDERLTPDEREALRMHLTESAALLEKVVIP